jgi:Rps23 Pro-64 3,4-dihydroxylase Tpa1-like proline 4-hydroxylase
MRALTTTRSGTRSITCAPEPYSREYGVIVNPYLQLTPLEGLTLRTQFGANAHIRRSDAFTPEFEIDQLEKSTYSNVSREMKEWLDWNWTNTANYMRTFDDKHNLNPWRFTAERFAEYWVKGARDDTPNNSENLQEVSAGTLNQQATGNTAYSTLLSYISGVLMYNYDGRYYLTASLRQMALLNSLRATNMQYSHLFRQPGV